MCCAALLHALKIVTWWNRIRKPNLLQQKKDLTRVNLDPITNAFKQVGVKCEIVFESAYSGVSFGKQITNQALYT